MNLKNTIPTLCLIIVSGSLASAQSVDYSVVQVPQEKGSQFVKITNDNDYVCMPLVSRNRNGIDWFTNRVIDVSPDGLDIAYISDRNNGTNIFIKSLVKQGGSTQRTNRGSVTDFSYSPDGKRICFAESKGKTNQIFVTGSSGNFICRQVTSGDLDYSPVFLGNKDKLIFARQESNGISIWEYDLAKNQLSNYASGMNPEPTADGKAVYVAKSNNGMGEIWKIDLNSGIEECILSRPDVSFYSPALSPDGRTLAVVGGTKIEDGPFTYWNTDIYTVDTGGSNLRQVTYHAADDLSPAWSADGNHIYFISQRGSADGNANIWRLSYEK